MRRRSSSRFAPFAFVLVTASTGLLLYACGGGDDSSGTTPGSDAGPGADATTLDGTITTTPDGGAKDGAAPADGSTPSDGGPKSDAGPTPPITACAAPVRVDTLGKANPQAFVAASFGGKYVFSWSQDASLSSDGLEHQHARWFDGTAYGTEVDVGPGFAQNAYATVDSTGKAYLVHEKTGPLLDRVVFDVTTGALVSTSGASFHPSDFTSYAVGALPQGALSLYQAPAGKLEIADLYTTGKGWSNGGDAGVDAGAPMPLTNSTAEVARVALASNGKGAIVFVENGASSSNLIHVTPFDGTKLGTTIDRNVTTGAELVSASALSNGDVVLAWVSAEGSATPSITFAEAHPNAAPAAQWDADVTVGNWALGGGEPLIFTDPHDNVTVVWVVDGAHVVAKKRIGTTWSTQIAVGASIVAVATLDPNGNIVAAVEDTSHNVLVTRMPEDGTAFGTPITTTLPSSNSPAVAFAFDAAGDPVVGVWGSHAGVLEIWAASCANGI